MRRNTADIAYCHSVGRDTAAVVSRAVVQLLGAVHDDVVLDVYLLGLVVLGVIVEDHGVVVFGNLLEPRRESHFLNIVLLALALLLLRNLVV